MRKQNKGKFHFWSYIGTLGFGRQFSIFLTQTLLYYLKNRSDCAMLQLGRGFVDS